MYQNWLFKIADQEQRNYFAKITREDFQRALLSVDYDRRRSICKFDDFMQRPNIDPTSIGIVHGTRIRLCPEPNILSFDEMEDDDPSTDARMTLPEIILGIYADKASYRAGKLSEEGYSSEEMTRRTPASQAPLECFHQLGGLEYCNVDEAAESRICDDWHKSNYVLVRNVYDDSIWVLWRKYRYAEGSADLVLAKDVFDADEYAVFPGMRGLEETIIYAKIADHWNLLDASLD